MATTIDGARARGGDAAAPLALAAVRLCESAGLRAGWRVLDVPTGSGDGALAAARLGCAAAGVDRWPPLLALARSRAAAEGLAVELVEADGTSLPFPDASFDAVTSLFPPAPTPQAAAELLRVCRAGGTIALAGRPAERAHHDLLELLRDGLASLELRELSLDSAAAATAAPAYVEAIALRR